MPGSPVHGGGLSRRAGIAAALILGLSAIGMQFSAMKGYSRIMTDTDPTSVQPAPSTLKKPTEEVCKTKEECVDCKKRPEAPEWWTEKK